MPRRRHSPPAYRLHKPSGQARVRIGGHEVYLGPHGSPESHERYTRLLAQWYATGSVPPTREVPPPRA